MTTYSHHLVTALSAAYRVQSLTRQWTVGRVHLLRRTLQPRQQALPPHVLKPNRVLLVLAGLIGDSVMSTPVLVEARRLWPKAHLALLGQKHNCELLAACPLLNDIKETTAIPFTIVKRRAVVEIQDWVRSQRFDVAIILLGDQFAPMLANAGIPVRVGVHGHLLSPSLTHSYSIGGPRSWGPPERLNALRSLGLQVEDVPPQLWVSAGARVMAQQRLTDLGLSRGQPYVILHRFGSSPRQWWPFEHVQALASELWARHELQTVLVGGVAESKVEGGKVSGPAVDATGLLSLQELVAVIEGAALVITSDSGPFHIAGALRRPTVGLFRSARPEHANRYPTAVVVLGRNPSCDAQCRWDYCRSLPCRQMDAIQAEEILPTIQSRLGVPC